MMSFVLCVLLPQKHSFRYLKQIYFKGIQLQIANPKLASFPNSTLMPPFSLTLTQDLATTLSMLNRPVKSQITRPEDIPLCSIPNSRHPLVKIHKKRYKNQEVCRKAANNFFRPLISMWFSVRAQVAKQSVEWWIVYTMNLRQL